MTLHIMLLFTFKMKGSLLQTYYYCQELAVNFVLKLILTIIGSFFAASFKTNTFLLHVL